MLFLNSCRCCLETSEEVKISLGTIYENGTIICLIKSITNVEISENDGLPQEICSNCLKGFLTAEEIKMQFMKSDGILRGLLEIKTEIQVDEEVEIDKEILEEFIMDFNDDIIIEEPQPQPVEIMPPATIKKKRKKKRSKEPKPPKPADQDVVCEICDLKIRNKYLLTVHIKEHIANNDDPLMQCPNCGIKLYSYKGINSHLCILKKVCYYCNIQCSGSSELFKHMKEKHCEFDTFICNYENCNYQCSRVESIFHHLSNHYAPLEILCEICSKKFTHLYHFYRHRRKHRKVKEIKEPLCCDLCGIYVRIKSNMARHMMRKHMNQRYYCDQCPKTYTDPATLKFHKVRDHNLDAEFTCELCDMKFIYKSQLILHQKSSHRTRSKAKALRIGYDEGSRVKVYDMSECEKHDKTEKKKFYCEICSMDFASRASLLRHLDIVHMKTKNYSCTYPGCNKSFGQKSTCDIHMRIHSREQIKCPSCEYQCTDPSTLSKHMKNIHKIQKPSIRLSNRSRY